MAAKTRADYGNAMTVTHVALRVWTPHGFTRTESVEVEVMEGDRFRVVCPPRFVYGLAVGDEFILAPALPSGFSVTRRSGGLTVWIYLTAPVASDAERDGLNARVNAVVKPNGWVYEGAPPGMVILTIPVAAGWKRIDSQVTGLVEALGAAGWEFGNVYDVIDGITPLNWWLDNHH